MQSAEKNKGSGKCAGEAGAGLCHSQPPSQEGRAERSQSWSAKTLHNVERCCRHWQVLFPHRSVCSRDGGDADRDEAHTTHKESTREHGEYKSVTGQPDKWQRGCEGQKGASSRYLSYPEPLRQGSYPWIGTDHPLNHRSSWRYCHRQEHVREGLRR